MFETIQAKPFDCQWFLRLADWPALGLRAVAALVDDGDRHSKTAAAPVCGALTIRIPSQPQSSIPISQYGRI